MTEDGQVAGMFGQSNQLFIENAGLLKEQLWVQWGTQEQQRCVIELPHKQMSEQKQPKSVQLLAVECK